MGERWEHPLGARMAGMDAEQRVAHALLMMARIARELARRNPDAAEMLGEALQGEARAAKTPVHGLGAAIRISLFTGRLEMRAGDLAAYVAGAPPGDEYVEVVTALPECVTG